MYSSVHALNLSQLLSKKILLIKFNEPRLAILIICKIVKNDIFKENYIKLEKQLPTRWNVLSPFIAADSLIRVEERLNYPNLSADNKHPIFLPKKAPN